MAGLGDDDAGADAQEHDHYEDVDNLVKKVGDDAGAASGDLNGIDGIVQVVVVTVVSCSHSSDGQGGCTNFEEGIAGEHKQGKLEVGEGRSRGILATTGQAESAEEEDAGGDPGRHDHQGAASDQVFL